jgi:hypothetical protein
LIRSTALVLAAAVALVGCTSSPPAPSGAPVPTPSSSSRLPTLPSQSPTPGGPSPIPTLTGPPGTLLIRTEGVGPDIVTLAQAPAMGSPLTVRLVCVGAGTAKVSDHTGGLIEATSGCQRGVIYSSAWSSTRRDGKTITVTVLRGTRWALDVWLGNPALTFATPAAA